MALNCQENFVMVSSVNPKTRLTALIASVLFLPCANILVFALTPHAVYHYESVIVITFTSVFIISKNRFNKYLIAPIIAAGLVVSLVSQITGRYFKFLECDFEESVWNLRMEMCLAVGIIIFNIFNTCSNYCVKFLQNGWLRVVLGIGVATVPVAINLIDNLVIYLLRIPYVYWEIHDIMLIGYGFIWIKCCEMFVAYCLIQRRRLVGALVIGIGAIASAGLTVSMVNAGPAASDLGDTTLQIIIDHGILAIMGGLTILMFWRLPNSAE